MTMTDKYVDAAGIRTHYLQAGSGAPVILVHGGGAGADAFGNWKDTIGEFAKHFEIYAPDMLGFGKTDKPDPEKFVYSTDARVNHLISFIEALGLKKVSMVGNSMGGQASLGVAMKRPDLVDRLVLMGSAGLSRFDHSQPRASQAITSYDAPDRNKMIGLIKTLTHTYVPSDELIDYRVGLMKDPQTMAAYIATMRWVEENGGLFFEDEDIAKVKTPSLIISGKNDRICQVWKSIRFSELIEPSWVHLIPNCGHWAMIEQPEDFNQATLHFLKKAL